MALTGHASHAARCTRWVTVAIFSHRDRMGVNRVRLTSMVAARRLTPGTYRIESVLLDATGKRHAFTATLRVTAPKVTRALVGDLRALPYVESVRRAYAPESWRATPSTSSR